MFCLTYGFTDSREGSQFIKDYAHPEDLRHSHKFKRPLRQQQSLLGRSLARGLCALATDVEPSQWRLIMPKTGPLTARSAAGEKELYMSICHSSNMVLAAVTGLGPIGIDVERTDVSRDMGKLLAGVYSGSPAFLPKTKRDRYQLWTLFEAYCKSRYQRLVFPIPEEIVTMSSKMEPGKSRQIRVGDSDYIFRSLSFQQYHFSVCLNIVT